MITAESLPVAHAGEDQASSEFAARSAHLESVLAGVQAAQAATQSSTEAQAPTQYWSIDHPEYDATSLAELITADNYKNDWLRAGDVVYIAEIRRHVLSDADLDSVARAVIASEA
jgi:hypothetical protein